jgi:pimeloyl-ACP methyl ester carboxylesterase
MEGDKKVKRILGLFHIYFLLIYLFALSGCVTTPEAQKDLNASIDPSVKGRIGVVFLHGKGGSPTGHIAPLVRAMQSHGIKVSAPVMPWAGSYSISYQGAMEIIDDRVAALREKGTDIIFVGGHSIGANGASGYGATRHDVDGIMIIAPGHCPSCAGFSAKILKSVTKAKKMVEEGRGSEKSSFDDLNQGRKKKISTTAEIYLSYLDPDGYADIAYNVRQFSSNTPQLWVVGKSDKTAWTNYFLRNPGYENAKRNRLNSLKMISANHLNTPGRSTSIVIDWINKVAMSKIQK